MQNPGNLGHSFAAADPTNFQQMAIAAAAAAGSPLGMMTAQSQVPMMRMGNGLPGFDSSQFPTGDSMNAFSGLEGLGLHNQMGMVRPQGFLYGVNPMNLGQQTGFSVPNSGSQNSLMYHNLQAMPNDMQYPQFFKTNFDQAPNNLAGLGFGLGIEKSPVLHPNPTMGLRTGVNSHVESPLLTPLPKQDRNMPARFDLTDQSFRRTGKAYTSQLEGMDYLEFDSSCIRRFEHEILKNPKLVENYALLDLTEVKREIEENESQESPDPNRFSLEKSDGASGVATTSSSADAQKTGTSGDKEPIIVEGEQRVSSDSNGEEGDEDETESEGSMKEKDVAQPRLLKDSKRSSDDSTTVATKSPSQERLVLTKEGKHSRPSSRKTSLVEKQDVDEVSKTPESVTATPGQLSLKSEEERVTYHQDRKDIHRLSGFFLKISQQKDSGSLAQNILDNSQSSQEYRTALESNLSKILSSKQKEYQRKYWLRKFFNFMTKQLPQSEGDEKFWSWVSSLNPDNSRSDTRFRSMSNEWLEFMLKYPKFREALRTWLDRSEYRILAELCNDQTKYQRAHAFAKYIRMLILIKNCQDFENSVLRNSGYDVPHDFDDGFNKESLKNHTKNGEYPREPFEGSVKLNEKFKTCIYRLQSSFKSARITELQSDLVFRVNVNVIERIEETPAQIKSKEEELNNRLYLISEKYAVSCNDFCDSGDHLQGPTHNSLASLPGISGSIGTPTIKPILDDMASSNLNSGTNSVNVMSPATTPQMTTLLGTMSNDDSLGRDIMMSRERLPDPLVLGAGIGTGMEESKQQKVVATTTTDPCLQSLLNYLKHCKSVGAINPDINPIQEHFDRVCERQLRPLFENVRSLKRSYKSQIQWDRDDAKKRIKRINENLNPQQ